MTIVENWWLVLKHAWSVRLMLLGLALSALAVVLPLMAPAIPPQHLLFYGALMFVVIFAAALCSRFVAQQPLQLKEPE